MLTVVNCNYDTLHTVWLEVILAFRITEEQCVKVVSEHKLVTSCFQDCRFSISTISQAP